MASPEPVTAGPLVGRVALVTGGSRGIGRGIALELAAAGAAVGVNYRRDGDAAAEVVAAIEAHGGRAVALQASVSELEDVDALADAAVAALGPVDLLVCNAGIASRGLTVADTDPAEVQRVVATHALSAHRLIARLVPGMRAAARGDVIAISSSEVSAMRANGAPYNMAKAALEALTLTVAHEEAVNGIRANIVAPGLVVTDMGSKLVKAKLGLEDMGTLDSAQPFGRVCRPEDIARTVRFLASQDAAMVTGQRIVVDGGVDAFPEG
jgi:NAD(P)-dependent dehydrogenase (short-subunit alcohol dehydrogenase family)